MSSRPRRRIRRSSDAETVIEETSQRRLAVVALIIGGVVILALIGVLVANNINAADPDTALTAQLGGLPRATGDTPRNFRLWSVYPDGKVRFQAAYFPVIANAPASEVVTIAGPLVNQPGDIQAITYFGALNISGVIQPGPGSDASRAYELFSLERDPERESYGINVLITNPPYLSADPTDARYKLMAMGAPPQQYYKQMIWGLALPPGSQVANAAFQQASDAATTMLRPYRRVGLDGWTIYYFDVSKLDNLQTIRIRYLPPAAGGGEIADPDFWQADRMR